VEPFFVHFLFEGTREDLELLAADFHKSDTNKTGELGFGEFTNLLKSRIPMDEAGYHNLFNQVCVVWCLVHFDYE
jgi:hypothetical protein